MELNPDNTTQPMEELKQKIYDVLNVHDKNNCKNPCPAVQEIAKLIAIRETEARIDELQRQKHITYHGSREDYDEWLRNRLKELNPNTDRKKVDV